MPDIVWVRMKYTRRIHAFTKGSFNKMDEIIHGWDGPRETHRPPICGCFSAGKSDIKEILPDLPSSRKMVCKTCLKKTEEEKPYA